MNSVIALPHGLPNLPGANRPVLQENYHLDFTGTELEFLDWFIAKIITDGNFATRLLEIATLAEYGRKHRTKFLDAEDARLKVKLPVLLSLKRMLRDTPLPPHGSDIRNGLLFKIDPLLVGIS